MFQNKDLTGKVSLYKTQQIVVVSGLPRSGTSMVMRMLEVGGIPTLTDDLRAADEDNPNGYYEFERVKKLTQGDTAWLSDARGKAIKIVAPLLLKLPLIFEYRVLLMRRKIEEVLASQEKMLKRRQEKKTIEDDTLAELFRQHIERVEAWMIKQANLHYITIDYNGMLADSSIQIQRINHFLGGELNLEAMSSVCDPVLYRQRIT